MIDEERGHRRGKFFQPFRWNPPSAAERNPRNGGQLCGVGRKIWNSFVSLTVVRLNYSMSIGAGISILCVCPRVGPSQWSRSERVRLASARVSSGRSYAWWRRPTRNYVWMCAVHFSGFTASGYYDYRRMNNWRRNYESFRLRMPRRRGPHLKKCLIPCQVKWFHQQHRRRIDTKRQQVEYALKFKCRCGFQVGAFIIDNGVANNEPKNVRSRTPE